MQIQGEVQALEVTVVKKVDPNDDRWQNAVGTVV